MVKKLFVKLCRVELLQPEFRQGAVNEGFAGRSIALVVLAQAPTQVQLHAQTQLLPRPVNERTAIAASDPALAQLFALTTLL